MHQNDLDRAAMPSCILPMQLQTCPACGEQTLSDGEYLLGRMWLQHHRLCCLHEGCDYLVRASSALSRLTDVDLDGLALFAAAVYPGGPQAFGPHHDLGQLRAWAGVVYA